MEMSIMFGYLIGKSVRANHISKAVPKIYQNNMKLYYILIISILFNTNIIQLN